MNGKAPDFGELLERVQQLATAGMAPEQTLEGICSLLREEVGYYDWVGFYLVDGSGDHLILGPFAGEPTEHVRIPFGRGICGQAAQRGETLVVQDVRREANYLSCSPQVRSEIVVPVSRGTRLVGELDIDSHTPAPFTPADRDFLEQVAVVAASLL